MEWSNVNCIDRNGEITEYHIHYQPKYSNDYPYYSSPATAVTRSRSYAANHLIPQVDYQFQVAAVNIKGKGPSASITLKTGPVKSKQFSHNIDLPIPNTLF